MVEYGPVRSRRGELSLDLDKRIAWPDRRAFAFTIFDDTDRATLENVAPVYEFLGGLGLRTTKSVWPLEPGDGAALQGTSCENPEYLAWTLDLQRQGFEIGYHGAASSTASREKVIRALDSFRDHYGHDPLSMANHPLSGESIYWGADRVSGIHRPIYRALTWPNVPSRQAFRGHRAGDPLFWGDICRQRVRYVRNFTFSQTNTLAACPSMPYHDPKRPYVAAWFAASEGAEVDAFNSRISEVNQDRLESEGGACIIYTHFAYGFSESTDLQPRFKELMGRLARKNGWFVPVATLLDYLAAQRGVTVLTTARRYSLERAWLRSKLRVGHT
jgi:hypothetical protein